MTAKRRTVVALVMGTLAGGWGSLPASQGSPLLARARTAIGIGTSGPVVTGLRLTGTHWSSQAVVVDFKMNQRRSEDHEDPFELRVSLPDRFVRIEGSASGRFVNTLGFNGTGGFIRSEGLVAGTRSSSRELSRDDITARELELWQILVGLAATPNVVKGLVASEIGANTLQVTGPLGFKARVELDPSTGRPVRIVRRLRFRVVPPRTVFGLASDVASFGAARIPDSEPEDDQTMTFADRRAVGGLWLPFRITISGKSVDMREYRFSEIVVNPPFTAKDFE